MSLLLRWFGSEDARERSAHGDPQRVAAAEAALDELRGMVAADGGALELVAVEGDVVVVALRGACSHCSASDATLFGAIQPHLERRLPWVRGVRAADTLTPRRPSGN